MRNSLQRDRNHMSNKQPIGCLDINNSKFVHTNNLFKIEIISITIDILITNSDENKWSNTKWPKIKWLKLSKNMGRILRVTHCISGIIFLLVKYVHDIKTCSTKRTLPIRETPDAPIWQKWLCRFSVNWLLGIYQKYN